MLKLAVCLCLVAVAFAAYPVFHPEEGCNSQGGMCMHKDDCPEGLMAPHGEELCPEQQAMGGVCCHGLPQSWKGCQQKGGECMSNCNNPALTMEADDCPANTKCCLLI